MLYYHGGSDCVNDSHSDSVNGNDGDGVDDDEGNVVIGDDNNGVNGYDVENIDDDGCLMASRRVLAVSIIMGGARLGLQHHVKRISNTGHKTSAVEDNNKRWPNLRIIWKYHQFVTHFYSFAVSVYSTQISNLYLEDFPTKIK